MKEDQSAPKDIWRTILSIFGINKSRVASTSLIAEAERLFGSISDELVFGIFSKSILKQWIKEQGPPSSARYCALLPNTDKSLIAAFLLADDRSFIYRDGARAAVVFRSDTVSPDIWDVVTSADREGSIALLPLHKEERAG